MKNYLARICFGLLAVVAAIPSLGDDGMWDVEAVVCGPNTAEQNEEWETRVRSAKRGFLFVPNPFPTSTAQVAENFIAKSSRLGRSYPRLFEVVQSGSARYETLRVQDWTHDRCRSTGRETPFHFVLRVFDERNGQEVARANVTHYGSLTYYTAYASPVRIELDELEQAARAASATIGLRLEAPQYVRQGSTIHCGQTAPCIALRDPESGDVYLKSPEGLGGSLFLLDLSDRVLESEATQEQLTAARNAALEADRILVGIGGDVFVTATKVPKARVSADR